MVSDYIDIGSWLILYGSFINTRQTTYFTAQKSTRMSPHENMQTEFKWKNNR